MIKNEENKFYTKLIEKYKTDNNTQQDPFNWFLNPGKSDIDFDIANTSGLLNTLSEIGRAHV